MLTLCAHVLLPPERFDCYTMETHAIPSLLGIRQACVMTDDCEASLIASGDMDIRGGETRQESSYSSESRRDRGEKHETEREREKRSSSMRT